MSRPTAVLVGVPGSGKSTLADLLAAQWGVPAVDVDQLVAAELGDPTAAFVTEEAHYREVEERLSLAALAAPGVVALPSGSVESVAVRQALAGHSVIWLQAGVATITRRLGMNLLGMDALVAIRNRLDAQFAERARWYSSVAVEVVATDKLTADQVAAQIAERGAER